MKFILTVVAILVTHKFITWFTDTGTAKGSKYTQYSLTCIKKHEEGTVFLQVQNALSIMASFR